MLIGDDLRVVSGVCLVGEEERKMVCVCEGDNGLVSAQGKGLRGGASEDATTPRRSRQPTQQQQGRVCARPIRPMPSCAPRHASWQGQSHRLLSVSRVGFAASAHQTPFFFVPSQGGVVRDDPRAGVGLAGAHDTQRDALEQVYTAGAARRLPPRTPTSTATRRAHCPPTSVGGQIPCSNTRRIAKKVSHAHVLRKDGGSGGGAGRGGVHRPTRTSVLTSQNLAPIWLPHWPTWRWTISRMVAGRVPAVC